MTAKTPEESIQLLYVRWSTENPMICSQCGSRVEFLYNDGGRTVITLQGKIRLYTHYYACTNKACIFYAPFTLPQEIVIPYKHYGLDVWHWVITSYMEFHDAHTSIIKRLKAYYGLDISPNTVKAIIETFLVASSQEADQETARLIRDSGRIYLAIDGQKPNNGESGLWLFIDMITNRILHMAYLKSAEWEVLAEIFRTIEKKYEVPIPAVISDHQQNIIKAVQEVWPGIPHQFCHYHFLKNLHRTINAVDSHLHVKLSAIINRLYICHLPSASTRYMFQGRELDLREWVAPLITDLTRLLREKTRDFDIFAGFNLYDRLLPYIALMDQLLQEVNPIKRLYTLIARTRTTLNYTLEQLAPLFHKLQILIPLFHNLRGILGGETVPKEKIKSQTANWLRDLQQLYKDVTGHEWAQDTKYQRITADAALEDILAEWIRLYSTHESGLFPFLDVKGLPRTNVALEHIFSLEMRHFRVASGNAQVGHLVRIKGGEFCMVLQNYDPDLINRVLLTSNKPDIQRDLTQFRQRYKLQTASWHKKGVKEPEICQLVKKAQEFLASP